MNGYTDDRGDEKVIRCPVCGEPRVFVEGDVLITGQIAFLCFSRKCRGKKRFINKINLQNMLDKFVNVAV